MSTSRIPAPVVDFVERVGSTAWMAGAAIYMSDPRASTLKPALIAAGLSAFKYVTLKVGAWQKAQADS